MPAGVAGLLAMLGLLLIGAVAMPGMLAVASAALAALVAALLVFIVDWGRRLIRVTVQGTSMSPTYADGDHVLVRRRPAVRVGDVVVIERPDADKTWATLPIKPGSGQSALQARGWMIKRVVAGPGDPIPRETFAGLDTLPGDHVPAGMLIIIGDNADASFDSRQLGFFPADRVLGTPVTER
ncbi:S26 family signal peptidase [Micromonospora arborensis]|uniref:S26 family signal peptidase n=1 Tax=Micromonospora arborensis TaxID=2116518 RepID=UPI003710CCAB